MPTPSALKTHILAQQSLSGYWASGNDQAIADWYAGDSGQTIRVSYLSRDRFLKAILPAVLAIPALANETKRRQWELVLSTIQASEGVTLDAQIDALLALGVTDGILTQGQSGAVGVRAATRAEIAFGEGVTVAHLDVAAARRV